MSTTPSSMHPRSLLPRWLLVALLLSSAGLLAPGCSDDDGGEGEGEGETGCAADTECAEGSYCYIAVAGSQGACAQGCRVAPDSCGEGKTCNAETRLCEVDDVDQGCESDADCEDAATYCDVASGECLAGCRLAPDSCDAEACEACDAATHQCASTRQCSDDDGCGAGQWCDATGCGTCEEGCSEDEDCPADTPFCWNHQCSVCLGCPEPCDDDSADINAHCPANFFCDDVTERCVEECASDGHCEDGWVCCLEDWCPNQKCIPACQSSDDCQEGAFCDDQGHCVEGCENDDACPPWSICDEQACRAGCRDDAGCEDPESYCDTEDLTCKPGCRSNDDCAGGHEVCSGTHECVPRPCADDAECPDAAYPDGYYCDVQTGVCALGCRSDASCPAAAEGDPPNVCGAEHSCVPGCVGDDSCVLGTVCELATGRCVDGCRDDDHEDNDTAGGAEAVAVADGTFSLAGLRVCVQPGDAEPVPDDDWFSVSLHAYESLEVTVSYDEAGDLGLEVYGEDGETLLGSSELLGRDQQVVSIDAVADARLVYVRVFATDVQSFAGLGYALSGAVAGAGQCVGDWAEGEEGNDSAAYAAELSDGEHDGLRLCPDDEDWFSFELVEGDGVGATLTYAADRTPLKLELFGPGDEGPELLATGTAVDGVAGAKALAVAEVFVSGTYLLRVFAAPGEPLNLGYALDLQPDRQNLVCSPDELEDNDSRDDPAPLAGPLYATSWQGLTLCAGDEDWYAIDTLAGDRLRVDLRHSYEEGDLELQLYQGAVLIQTSSTANDDERLYVEDLQQDTYLLRVYGRGPADQASYDLEVSLDVPACVADAEEPNDDMDNATALSCGGEVQSLVACAEDGDYFEVELYERSSLIGSLSFVKAAGQLDLELLTRDGDGEAEVDSGTGEGDLRTVIADGLDAGTYYLHVWPVAGQANRYSLGVECTPEADLCPGDQYDPNDSSMLAAAIPALPRGADPLVVDDLSLCSADDEDWYQFFASAGDQLDILVEFFHFSEGDLDAELYCGLDQALPVASSTTQDDDEHILYAVQSAGICKLRIFGLPQDETGADYSITFEPVQ